MGFEEYQPGKHNEQPNEHRRLWEKSEANEREKKLEIQKSVVACAEYHKKLDGAGSYFNSKAANEAAKLLPVFNAIRKDKLPACLRNVLAHRIAYLELITGLGANKKLMALIDKFQPTAFKAGLFAKDTRTIQASREYKELDAHDFEQADKTVKSVFVRLKALNTQKADWGKEAEQYLRAKGNKVQDPRVDDQSASLNLEKGLQIVMENFRNLQVFQRNQTVKNPRKST